MFLSFGTMHVLTCVYTYMCVGTKCREEPSVVLEWGYLL